MLDVSFSSVGNENSAQSLSDRSFWKSLRVVDVRAFGSWMSALKCLFFPRILTALTEVLGRDIRANDPRMSAGCPPPKLPLWADFSFLILFFLSHWECVKSLRSRCLHSPVLLCLDVFGSLVFFSRNFLGLSWMFSAHFQGF